MEINLEQEARQGTWWPVGWLRIRKCRSWSLRLDEGMSRTRLVVQCMNFLLMRHRDPENIAEITTPARAFETRNGPNDWKYKTTFIDRPDYTRVEKPNTRGKVLGGSSCLNYYTWVRGSKATFDDWEEFGGEGWNWHALKDYFDKVHINLTLG